MTGSEKSINRNILRGIGWSVAMRWAMRAVGFVSIIITARILDPEDFGIWAMAMITFGLAENFSELGVQQLLIRSKDESREQRDTAWTLKLLQQSLVGLVLVTTAPFVAHYFDEPRIIPVTMVLAASAVISGFNNIGLVIARKEFQFELDFKFNVYGRFSKFFATIGFAIILQNYWGLILGYFFGSIVSVIISYRLHPYRPRFCLKHYKEYLRFGSAIIPQRIGKSIYNRLDAIFVGVVADAEKLGIYNVAAQLAQMAANEIALPIGRGLYPNFTRLVTQPKAFADAYCRVLAATCVFVFPVAAIFLLVSTEFISLVFGKKWLPAVTFIDWLILYASIESITVMMSQQILIVTGHERQAALFMWIKLTLLAVFLSIGVNWQGVEGVAFMRPVVSFISFFIAAAFLTRLTPISVSMLMASISRPLVSCVVAYIATFSIFASTALLANSDFAQILLRSTTYLCVYLLTMLLLWHVSGKPDGLERIGVQYLVGRFRSR